jgi:SAM-dependent methyltransferase
MNATHPAEQASWYAWGNGWDRAQRRLRLLESWADAGTIRRFDAIGVAPGWSCLEVAGGGGSVARWLRDRVGPTGRVVATDLDTRFLEGIESSGLEVLRHDVRAQSLPTGFDVVHTRALLMHLPERERVLDELVRAVAPGGWLYVEDPDLFPMMSFGSDAYATAWRIIGADTTPVTGLVTDWARHLPEHLASRGLVDVVATADTRFFNGGSELAEWVALTWQQAVEQLKPGATEMAALSRAQRELADPGRWFTLPAIVAAWGRKVDSPHMRS